MTEPFVISEIETAINAIRETQRIPSATYRLQFSQDFTFQQAYELIPYLHDLGITDCYASPLFKARSDSSHGYDIVDYSQLNPALGTQAEFDALAQRLQDFKMGLILDFVPNHMGIGPENAWWMDVLSHGPSSLYARYFDINWDPPNESLKDKVLLPILESHYGQLLENQKFHLEYDGTTFSLTVAGLSLPIGIATTVEIIHLCSEYLHQDAKVHPDISSELGNLIASLKQLSSNSDQTVESIPTRLQEEIRIQNHLSSLYATHLELQEAVAETLKDFNGVEGDPHSFDRLDHLISEQPYHLAFWRVAADEINYRRFFDINTMAAIRTELPDVFEAAHQLLFKFIRERKVTGVRIDHPDGLWDPTTYFLKLQEYYVHSVAHMEQSDKVLRDEVIRTLTMQLKQSETQQASWPLYVVVEKILSEIEALPHDWAVYGTTGYDFLIALNNIFVNRDHVHAFTDLYSHFVGQPLDYRELIYQSKKLIITYSLASEIAMRSQQLATIVERNRQFDNFTLNSLRMALTEVAANMSIYRTYITEAGQVSDHDRHYIEMAVTEAKQRNPQMAEAVYDFVHHTLLLDNLHEFDENQRREVMEFVIQFQQITGPIMAKGVEDTAFYVYNRLVSLNEVGGNPEQFGIGLEDFHKHNMWHLQHWPHTMLSISTHDTKRSADARARLNVLSEIPGEWEQAIWRWSEMNDQKKTTADEKTFPDRNDEYLLYQAIFCANGSKSSTNAVFLKIP